MSWLLLGILLAVYYLALVLYYLVYEVVTAPVLDSAFRVVSDPYHRCHPEELESKHA
jgi:hypothetical protein